VKHADALRAYRDLVIAAPVSLTSVREPEAAWRLHVADALTAVPLVNERAPARLIDVGSGGGSPGVPLAIETGRAVTLLEARAPKVRFLQHVVDTLDLACEVVHGRSEELARAGGRDAWDMALARALAPPAAAVELCLPLVRPGGCVVLWSAAREAEGVGASAALVAGRLATVVPTSGSHALLVIEKTGPTPAAYPRRPGAARRRPPASLRSRP
jgi:16S rRNA (guanine527-N7)-methyltransferase